MIYLEILKLALPVLMPLLGKLVEKTGIPYIKFRKYKQMDKYADLVLEGLAELKQKVEDEPDSISKTIRLEGFELGCDYVYRLAHKLLDGLKLIGYDYEIAFEPDRLNINGSFDVDTTGLTASTKPEDIEARQDINTNILGSINNFFNNKSK